MDEGKSKLNIFISTLISIGILIVFSVGFLLLISYISLKTDMSSGLTDFLLILCLCMGGFVSGYANGRIQQKKGLIYGAVTGGIASLILLLCSLGSQNAVLGIITVTKILMLIAFAALGGICGVNRRQKRLKF